jgi:hypothetical protein
MKSVAALRTSRAFRLRPSRSFDISNENSAVKVLNLDICWPFVYCHLSATFLIDDGVVAKCRGVRQISGEAKEYFVPLTGEDSVDAYDAWMILASKLDDLPEGAREYFKRLCAAVEEFDRCCQTNDCKHQIDGAIEICALNN